jgi:hypothetical protein
MRPSRGTREGDALTIEGGRDDTTEDSSSDVSVGSVDMTREGACPTWCRRVRRGVPKGDCHGPAEDRHAPLAALHGI